MSTAEEQIKAAIVIYGDKIAFVEPDLNEATKLVCGNLYRFVDYIQVLDPKLERHEAITVVAAMLDGLPSLLETDPDLIAGIKAECQELRNNR